MRLALQVCMTARGQGIRSSDVLRWSLLAVLGSAAQLACTERAADDAGTGAMGPIAGDGGAGTGTKGSVVGDGGGGLVSACDHPEPLLVRGVETGFVTCGDGRILHRPERVDCPSFVPRAEDVVPVHPDPGGGGAGGDGEFVPFDECTNDADCSGPYAHCAVRDYGPLLGVYLGCATGCISDDDCGSGALCLCGDPVGTCVPATCETDDDCESDCSAVLNADPCGDVAPDFACATSEGECLFNEDCEPGGSCTDRSCNYAVCGRPFLVEQVERLAELELRSDWLEPKMGGDRAPREVAGASGLAVEELKDAERARLAEHWARIGLMEHASIAAFARFTLQLLALGAPVELVELSNAATVDETKHARRCFAQASRFAGRDLGPSALGMHGALGEVTLAEVVQLVLLEGCVGETVAALEASAARDRATDAEVRELLAEIADDEARHAELAWHFVSWALQRDPKLAAVCERVFAELREEVGALGAVEPGAARSGRLEAFGLLGEESRRALRREALEAVVLPCGAALLARTHRLGQERLGAAELVV